MIIDPPHVGTASARIRKIAVTALDGRMRPAAGALVGVFVRGAFAGALTIGGEHPTGSVEIDDPAAPVRLVARFGGEEQAAELGLDDRAYVFVFSLVVEEGLRVTRAEARCPDGTTGRPCVECAVAGTKVRICV